LAQSAFAASGRHTLLVLDPGHFHAALTLRRAQPNLNDDVYVYANTGPDVDAFVALVESFNARMHDPTHWRLHVYRGSDCLERLIAERRGEVVIVAGRNDRKLAHIATLHARDFAVLGDKPWLIEPEQLSDVQAVSAGAPLAMDIMTERYEVANRIQRALIARGDVFGGFRSQGDEPSIEMVSTHHLYKTVNGRPLKRPEWYFDVGVQGEGIADVTTHLVDLAQWFVGGEPLDYAADVVLRAARQWPTSVPLSVYAQITGAAAFPAALSADVKGDALAYRCNAEIEYAVRGVPVRIQSVWALEIPKDGGDQHHCIARGQHADLVVEQVAATRFVPELFVRPHAEEPSYAMMLSGAIAGLQSQFPGIVLDPAGAGGFHIRVPQALRSSHEQHFAAVLDQFLAYVSGVEIPRALTAGLVCKYTLLANATQLARRGL
jgi:predicted dehydrogenase